jgi:hypothetical protein
LPSLIAIAFLSGCVSATAAPKSTTSLGQLQFLVGDWKGVLGGSINGTDMGVCTDSFHWDLQKNVIVNRVTSTYPPENGKPGYTYEALMVLAKDATTGGVSGEDYDSVGDDLRFTLVQTGEPGTAVFLCKSVAENVVFRSTYHLTDPNTCTIDFEMQMAGKPFVSYATGKINRTKTASRLARY